MSTKKKHVNHKTRTKAYRDAMRYMMYKCPVPGCTHVGKVITKFHCESVHGMTREKLFKIYGEPKGIEVDPQALKRNLKMYVPMTPVNRTYHRKSDHLDHSRSSPIDI